MENKILQYKIDFFSSWHCGSGLSAGADVDALVVRDRDGLPYVPGKTVKGLVREAVEDFLAFRKEDIRIVADLFGNAEDRNNLPQDEEGKMKQGILFFSNAELLPEQKQIILDEHLKPFLFDSVAATRIAEDGIAMPHSLRRIQVVLPCTLYGQILDVPEESKILLQQAVKLIKRMGLARNRGLGRCSFTIME